MNRRTPSWANLLWMPLCLLIGAVASAPARSTPSISFEPVGRTFYGANQQIKVHLCDESSIRDASTKVWLNGVQITTPSWTAGDASCAVHKVLTLNLTFTSGSNTVQVQACETIAPESCIIESESYTWTTPDAVKPAVQVSPGTGTFASPSLPVTITWCDDYKLNLTTTQAWLNNTPLSLAAPTPVGPQTYSCYGAATTPVTLTLQPGANAFKAVVRDSAGNVADTMRATFTYTPTISVVGEDRVRRPGLCAGGCFDASLGYGSHTFTAMDVARGVSLTYSSAHAEPRGMVSVDVAVGSGPVPSKIGLSLYNSSGALMPLFGTAGQTSAWYAGAAGTNRVSAWFDASSLATGTYRYLAVVARTYGATTQTDTVFARVIVVNEIDSPYGSGWSLGGDAKVVLPGGTMDATGVTVVTAGGSASFFTAPGSCSGTVTCTYVSPPSEFNTLYRTSTGYALVSPEADSVVFSTTGKLVYTSDRMGNRTSYAYYDTSCSFCVIGRLASITFPTRAIYIGYNTTTGRAQGFNILDTYVGPHYDASGNLVYIDDPDGVKNLLMTYSGHRVTGWTDRAGNHTDLTFDRWGKVASVIGPAFRAQGSSGWRDTTRMVSYEKAVLPVDSATFTSPAAAVSPATAYAWVITSRNDSTRLHLDGWRAADQVRDPRGYVATVTRNADALTTTAQDAKGNTITNSWNGRLLTQVTDPNGTVQYEYDSNGRVTRAFGDAPETKYFYSSGARWVVDSVHVAGQGTTRFTYDTRGRVRTQGDSLGHTVTVEYDTTSSGWMNTLRVIEPGSRTTAYGGWDSFGRATQVTGPDNAVSHAVYDVLGRMTSAVAPDSGITTYYYGAAQLDSLKDARNQVFKWTRNQLGWVETEFRPDDGSAHRTAVYDRYGRAVSSTDRRGQTVTYAYDTRDRATMMVAGTDTTRWSYSPDQPGVPTAPSWTYVQNAASADSLHYDTQGRLARTVTIRNLQAIPNQKYEVAYTYNDMGGVDTLKYRVNGGAWEWSRFVQDPSTGALTSIRDFGGRTTSLLYNGEGALRQVTYPNSQVGLLSYTSTHQLSRLSYSAINLRTAAGVGFTYDNDSRIARQSYNLDTQFRDFGYDTNGRLASHTDLVRTAAHPGCQLVEDQGYVCANDAQFSQTGQRSYTYDLTDNPTDRGALIGLNNRLNGYDGWTMTYDLEGHLTGKSKSGSPTYGYTWDALGRLASVQVNGVTSVTYGYDGLGRRVFRDGSGGRQYFVYQGENLLLEIDNSAQVAEEYTYIPGSDAPFALRHGGIPFWFHTDPQGNVLAITDQYGNVANRYKYAPFGATDSLSESFSNRLRSLGREWDADAGLYYNRARWYDPQLQRFISQDPIGIEGGLNLYAYAGNDPVNASDPSGLITCDTHGKYSFGQYGVARAPFEDCLPLGTPSWMERTIQALRRCSDILRCQGEDGFMPVDKRYQDDPKEEPDSRSGSGPDGMISVMQKNAWKGCPIYINWMDYERYNFQWRFGLRHRVQNSQYVGRIGWYSGVLYSARVYRTPDGAPYQKFTYAIAQVDCRTGSAIFVTVSEGQQEP